MGLPNFVSTALMAGMDNLLTFYDGNKEALRILPVMAAEAEYGDALKALGVKPVIIGVGPVNAALNTMAVLKDMEDGMPDIIINIGSAGSNVLEHQGVYQAGSVAYRDMDARPFGFAKGLTPFSNLPAVLPIKARLPGLPVASVSTGAQVISGEGYDAFAEEAAEMEAYAVYSACLHFGIPMIKIFGISDGKEALSGKIGEWTDYLAAIDAKIAGALKNLEEELKSNSIARKDLLLLPDSLKHENPDKNF